AGGAGAGGGAGAADTPLVVPVQGLIADEEGDAAVFHAAGRAVGESYLTHAVRGVGRGATESAPLGKLAFDAAVAQPAVVADMAQEGGEADGVVGAGREVGDRSPAPDQTREVFPLGSRIGRIGQGGLKILAAGLEHPT